jgi:hypothetical protein
MGGWHYSDAHGAGSNLSGRRDSMAPMLKQLGSFRTSEDGSDWRPDSDGRLIYRWRLW